MIPINTPAKVEPFAYKAPELPARPFGEGSGAELEANRSSLLLGAQAYTYTDELLQRATPGAQQIAKDGNLSEQGKRIAFTEHFVKPALTKLNEHLAALDKAEAVIKSEAEQIQQVATAPASPPDGLRAERSAIAAAFRDLSVHMKKQALERGISGKDPALADALAYSHPMLSGLTENTIQLLRTELEGSRIDPAAVEAVKDKAFKLSTVRRAVTMTMEALERSADHQALKDAGLATLRRSDLDAVAASKFIDAKGLAAYKALPA